MAAICCAIGDESLPVTIRTTPKQSASPARNAALIIRMRVLRAVISDPAACCEHSPAGGDPCEDHLVEHCGTIVGPERHRCGKQDADGRRDEHERTRKQGCRSGNRLGHRRPRLDRPVEVRPHAYEIGPIVAADNGSGCRGGHQRAYRPARRSLTPQSRKNLHFTKRSGNSKFTRSPRIPGGTGGKGCARCNSASASSSSALAPDERTMRLSTSRPCRSRLKKTWATPCSPRRVDVSG